jgi:hypothetical protein
MMSAAVVETPPTQITEPGVYDLPEAVYHADPVPDGSLSHSGAKRLLPPSCPAIFRHEQLHGRADKRAFDFGHAAHSQVLGTGAQLVVVDADDWRTKAAQEQRKAAYAAGHVPILTEEYEQVCGMAEALRSHPVASALFDPKRGQPEQSLFWQDERFGIWRRARLDWLPFATDGRMIVGDYKSCVSAEPSAFAKSVWNYGYYMQVPWYLDGVTALGLADRAAFVLVAQEKTAPYVVSVFELDTEAIDFGRRRNEQAMEVYVDCKANDTWPAYTSDVELLSLPAWAVRS